MKKLSSVIALLIVTSGCSYAPFYVQEGAKKYDHVSPDKVQVFTAESLKREYDVIGSIAVDVYGDSNDAYKMLREKAADHGANAVISTRLTKMISAGGRTGLSGTMIRTL